MMGDFDFSDFPDFANLGGDIDWSSLGDDIDWGQILGPDYASIFGPDSGFGEDVLPPGYTDDLTNLPGAGVGTNLGTPGGPMPDVSQYAGLLRALGIGGRGGSDPNGGDILGGLLPLLGIIGGGISSNNATRQASHQMMDAANNANTQVKEILGGAGAGYKPFTDAGAGALSQFQNRAPSNLSAGVKPIAPQSNLAGGFNPLGSGRSLRSLVR
jgi:hypothetical protein